jgi:hypothetical protein
LTGCSNEAVVTSSAASQGGSSQETIEFSVGAFPDATIDIAVDVVDASTLAVLFSQSYPAQTTPFSSRFSFAPTPVDVSITVAFHLLAASTIHDGTNTGAGTTLTDLAASYFGYVLPLFVVDNPSAPTAVADVQAVATFTSLTLKSPFPAGPYYIFQTKQMYGTITRTYAGTQALSVFTSDNVVTPVQFSTRF